MAIYGDGDGEGPLQPEVTTPVDAGAGAPRERGERLAAAVNAIRVPVRWLARTATLLAMVAAVAAVVIWWIAAGQRTAAWWEGTVRSLLVLAVLLLPALWLVNLRMALLGVLELPSKLGDITRHRAPQLRRVRVERPQGGMRGALRSVRGLVGDYGEVTGSWGLVMQLVTPWFWFLTVAAVVAAPLLALAAVVSGLAALL